MGYKSGNPPLKIICNQNFIFKTFCLFCRAEAWMTEFFYNNTQRGFCETRVINQTLSLRFVGTDPMVFKPGMPFEAQIAVRYHDQVALTQEQLESSTLLIKATAKLQNGKIVDLPEIKVPKKLEEGFSLFQDIDRLKHYGQVCT